MVYAVASIALLSFVVWAHHMFTVGMPLVGEVFFMFATMLIAVPTGVKVFNWVATMFRGSMTFETPCCSRLRSWCCLRSVGSSGLMLAMRLQTPVPRHLFCGGALPLRAGTWRDLLDHGSNILLAP